MQTPCNCGANPAPQQPFASPEPLSGAQAARQSALKHKHAEMIACQNLPRWAKVAIEMLDACIEWRNQSMLDHLLNNHAKFFGQAVDDLTRESVRNICRRRFADSYTEPPQCKSVPPGMPRPVRLAREGALIPGDRIATRQFGACGVICTHAPQAIGA